MTLQRWAQCVVIEHFESASTVVGTVRLLVAQNINYWWKREIRVMERGKLLRYVWMQIASPSPFLATRFHNALQAFCLSTRLHNPLCSVYFWFSELTRTLVILVVQIKKAYITAYLKGVFCAEWGSDFRAHNLNITLNLIWATLACTPWIHSAWFTGEKGQELNWLRAVFLRCGVSGGGG